MVVTSYFEHLKSAGGAERPWPLFSFWMGLIPILVGTAARSREVMLHLASGRAWEATTQDSGVKSVASANTPGIHADS